MTISQDTTGATPLARVVVRAAEIDDYDIAAYCPVCRQRVDDLEGVHDVPASVVGVDDQEFVTDGGDAIEIYGYRCERHRLSYVLPAPASIAPTGFETVELEIGDDLEAATPRGDRR